MKREHPRNAWIFPDLEKLCKKQSKPAFVSYHYIFGKNQYITDVVVFSCLFFSVFDKFNFSSMRAAIGEKYLQTLLGRSNFWPSLFVWFFFLKWFTLSTQYSRDRPRNGAPMDARKNLWVSLGDPTYLFNYIYIYLFTAVPHGTQWC